MICPSCAHENRESACFCEACGAPLAAACPRCGVELRSDARFCDACGHAVIIASTRAHSVPDNSARNALDPRGYTPKHLADKILQSKSALEGERKQVTVLFADVKGSMELAEQIDPEEWHRILNRFFEILADGVHRFEGTVNQYTGDGIMALFGAPIAHEDHAHRACYAALHLSEELRRYANQLRVERELSFSVRMGLNSGEVIVGKIGDDLRMDYTAQGHTVGLAARMEQLAEPGKAFLTENTASLVTGFFQMEDLGPVQAKGARAPVRVFELQGVGPMRTRLDVSRARGLTRFVGRDQEMATLEAALSSALEGNGRVVGVMAEPGTGKSRLGFEFAEHCRARGIRVREAHALAHGKSIPFLPILEFLRDYFGVQERDTDEEARHKIAGRVLLLDEAVKAELPILFDFLGIPDPKRPSPTIDPEARQKRLIGLVRRIIQARSREEPAVVLFEDMHWIDPGSEAFIENVMETVAGTRTLLLLTFRPEYRAEWMTKTFYQQIPLLPLGPEAIAQMLLDLLGADPSVSDLRGRIVAHTGGNPFFVEEVVQSLLEAKILEGRKGAYRLVGSLEALALPPTVQAVLAARIDRLPEREKQLLNAAAVIGKRFGEGVLGRVANLPGMDLASALHALMRAEFIYQESLYPEAEYAFKHPLTQEVAYRSQLAAQRRRVHVAVARALEELHADKLDEHAALLAHHWDLGGEVEPAARWHRRAAEWIAGRNSEEARRHWHRVRELSEQVGDIELALELGHQSRLMILEYGWRLGASEAEVNELLHEGEAWARRNDDPRALAALYNAFCIPCMFSLGNPHRAREVAEEGLRLAERAGDAVLACALELRLFFIFERLGLGPPAMSAAMEAVLRHSPEVLEQVSPLAGYNAPATATGFRGWAYGYAGQLDVALDHYRRGIALARANDAVEVAGWLLSLESILWCERGEIARASGAAREALEIAERIESPLSQAIALHSFGVAAALAGDAPAAVSALERAVSLAERVDLVLEPEILSDLALVHCAAGAFAEARSVAERTLDLAGKRGLLRVEVRALRALARVHLDDGAAASLAEARRLLDRAESRAEETGYRLIRPSLYELRSDLARREGDAAAAEAALREAQRLYGEMGAPLQVERLRRELGA